MLGSTRGWLAWFVSNVIRRGLPPAVETIQKFPIGLADRK